MGSVVGQLGAAGWLSPLTIPAESLSHKKFLLCLSLSSRGNSPAVGRTGIPALTSGERTVLITPFSLQRRFCFPAWSGLFLAALPMLLGLWEGLIYPDLLQILNLLPGRAPSAAAWEMAQRSLQSRFNFSSLPPGKPGRAGGGTAQRGSSSIDRSQGRAVRLCQGRSVFSTAAQRWIFEDAPAPATTAFHSLPSTARPSQSSVKLI